MIEIETGSGNVYADIGMVDADEMIVKAQLASKIGEIIKGRKWSQQKAAEVLGITQPKLSKMLRGQFRGISEAKMLDCLARLGRDVQIVIGPARRSISARRVAVVFTAWVGLGVWSPRVQKHTRRSHVLPAEPVAWKTWTAQPHRSINNRHETIGPSRLVR